MRVGKMEEHVNLFNFETALHYIKNGKRVCRDGWNGKGMYLYYVPSNKYATATEIAKKDFGDYVEYSPYIAIKTVNNIVSIWNPSQMDMFADDWRIYNNGDNEN